MKLEKDTVPIKAETLHPQEVSHCSPPIPWDFLTHVGCFSGLSDTDFSGLFIINILCSLKVTPETQTLWQCFTGEEKDFQLWNQAKFIVKSLIGS